MNLEDIWNFKFSQREGIWDFDVERCPVCDGENNYIDILDEKSKPNRAIAFCRSCKATGKVYPFYLVVLDDPPGRWLTPETHKEKQKWINLDRAVE